MPGILIIGAGECGVRAAFALRDNGYTDAITLFGDEAQHPYERPPLSKAPTVTTKLIREEAAYDAAGILLRLDTAVTAIDTAGQQIELSDGTRQSYDKLLIATGARARVFPTLASCETLRTHQQAEAILSRCTPDSHVGVIGGGFIGLELAATARQAGSQVTVFESAPQLMGRAVPADIAAVMQKRHEDEGVKLMLNAQVSSATDRQVTLADGTAMDFDVVVAGVGAVPNTEMAEAAGIETDNGIVVDDCFRTSAPNVFAAGDCCNFSYRGSRMRLESWRAAQEQGAHAAAAMLGEEQAYASVPWFWSDQYDLSLQVAGIMVDGGILVKRELDKGGVIQFQLDDAGTLVAVAGVGPGNSVAKDIKIAEKLIEKQARPDETLLADKSVNLKSLLKSA